MEEIVLRQLVREIYFNLQNTILEGGSFSTLEDRLKIELDKLGRTLLQEVIICVDGAIIESEERKKRWNIKRRRSRELKTVFGDVILERTYFQHKKTGSYAYLTDLYLELDKYQRLSEKTKYELISNACDLSYAKSAERLGVTAKTTSNVLKKVNIEELKKYPEVKEKKKIDTLFICADEDHITIRKKGKKMQYLIYVYEEITGNRCRHKLENIHYFTRKQAGDPEQLWLEVTDYIYNIYDTDNLKKIYLMGDGAAWIKQGLNWLPKVSFVLDKWHLSKYIQTCSAMFEHEQDYQFKQMIWRSIEMNDKKLFQKTVQKMRNYSENDFQKEKLRQMKKYVLNNWDGIQNLYLPDIHGCSAEGHISHMLSSRLSSRPMVWGEDGANKIAALRVFRKNGGEIKDLDLRDRCSRDFEMETISQEMGRTITNNIRNSFYSKQVTIPLLHTSKEEELKIEINRVFGRTYI